jgi:hypothetical protein
MSAGSNTALLMNGIIEIMAPTLSRDYLAGFHLSRGESVQN